MYVPIIYVVGFEPITQIMLTIAYSSLVEVIIRAKQFKKVWFTHHILFFHYVKIHILDTNTK
jgi:hypothetical protein